MNFKVDLYYLGRETCDQNTEQSLRWTFFFLEHIEKEIGECKERKKLYLFLLVTTTHFPQFTAITLRQIVFAIIRKKSVLL